MIGGQPKRVAAYPHAFEAPGQGTTKLLVPAAGDSLHVEFLALEIPLTAVEKFDTLFRQVSVEVGHVARHRGPGLRLGDRFGDCPDAEFVVLQSGLEEGHAGLKQILFGRVEQADVSAPGNLTEDGYSGPF